MTYNDSRYAKPDANEIIKWMSRDAKRFLGQKPYFDYTPEYESDVDSFVKCHPSWVSSIDDLTPLGVEVHNILKANPDLIDI